MTDDLKLDLVEITPALTDSQRRRMLPSKHERRRDYELPAMPADYRLPPGSGTVVNRAARFRFAVAALVDTILLGPWRRRRRG